MCYEYYWEKRRLDMSQVSDASTSDSEIGPWF